MDLEPALQARKTEGSVVQKISPDDLGDEEERRKVLRDGW